MEVEPHEELDQSEAKEDNSAAAKQQEPSPSAQADAEDTVQTPPPAVAVKDTDIPPKVERSTSLMKLLVSDDPLPSSSSAKPTDAADPTPLPDSMDLDTSAPPKPEIKPDVVDKVAKEEEIATNILSTGPLPSPNALREPPEPSPPRSSTPSPGKDASFSELDAPVVLPSPPSVSFEPPTSNIAFGRQLNVTDALSYLDAVKQQFHDKPNVYNHFLDIMKDFKSQLIDTPGVIERVSDLFSDHPVLIQGFNTFLPVGYRIECTVDAHDANLITVTTPTGTTTQTTGGSYLRVPQVAPGPATGSSVSTTAVPSPVMLEPVPTPGDTVTFTQEQISPAMAYVTKIKQRFADHTDLYREFLDILDLYKKGSPVDEAQLATRIAKLFQNAPDLLSDFQVFMPQGILPNPEVLGAIEREDKGEKSARKKADGPSGATASSSGATKRKRKPVDKDKEKPREIASKVNKRPKVQHNDFHNESMYPQYRAPTPPHHRSHQHGHLPPQHQQPPSLSSQHDAHFFERVRRALDNLETYNEFLKLINLFTQEIIDLRKLVEQAYVYLGDGELMAQFKDILGVDAKWEKEVLMSGGSGSSYGRGVSLLDRQNKADMHIRNGPSYRRLPASEQNVTCTGRDEMCKSVLNDEWVSHPTWASEDAGFVAHRKNAYEEALHRSEEERHEYDFHVEAIVRTIAALEATGIKMAQLPPDQQAQYKAKSPFGGPNKSVFPRIIKKIYGRDAGVEVIQALHDCPFVAVPIVLSRLKQKEEQWRRAQREWNKVWREVDARNFQKSLDHQGITFKANDKKAITTKTLVNQIEAAREEQMSKRASLIDPLFARTRPRYNMAFVFDDMSVLQDLLKLTFSFLDRMQHSIGFGERKRMESFLRTFVPMVFMLDPVQFNTAFVMRGENGDGDVNMSDDLTSLIDDSDEFVTNSRHGRNGRRGGNDLRKKLLKGNTQDKTIRKTRAGASSNPNSRLGSPFHGENMAVDEQHGSSTTGDSQRESKQGAPVTNGTTHESRPSRRGTLFANVTLYSLLRLIELLHSRLLSLKRLASKLAEDNASSSSSYLLNPTASELALLDTTLTDSRLLQMRSRGNPPAHFYEFLLESCERMFDNELDQQTFEEMARHMFGTKAYIIFTIDKVIGAILKQVQLVLSDAKIGDILENLRRERELHSPTHEDQAKFRATAQEAVGPDENLFRFDWVPDSKTLTIELLGKDDTRFEDPEVVTGRWQAYIDSYVSDYGTSNVPADKIKSPFLRRNLKHGLREEPAPAFSGRSGLEIKVCVRTYRLFFVSDTEDVLWRSRSAAAREWDSNRAASLIAAGQRWLERFSKSGALPQKRIRL